MLMEAALASEANLTESYYVNIMTGEFMCYESRTAFRMVDVCLVKNVLEIATGNFIVLFS